MKLIVRFLPLLVAGAASLTAAAGVHAVRGRVADTGGQPVMYATYRVFSLPDSVKPVIISTADSAGVITTEVPDSGRYLLRVNAATYAPLSVPFVATADGSVTDLGELTLAQGGTVGLREVEVTAQRPLVSKDIDRIAYDVTADDEATTQTVIETLRKVPLVTVSGDNSITVNGSSSFKVFKNGKPNSTFTNNPREVLASIPSSMIRRIEVITEPGARYDAEGTGAILNIVTVERMLVKGVMGRVGVTDSYRKRIPCPSVWLQTQIGNVTFSLSGSTGWRRKGLTPTTSHGEHAYVNGDHDQTTGSSESLNYSQSFAGEMSWEPDTLNLFTLGFNGYHDFSRSWHRSDMTRTAPDGSLDFSYDYLRYSRSSYLSLSGEAAYQHTFPNNKGHFLTFNYLLSLSRTRDFSEMNYEDAVNMPVDYTRQTQNGRPHFTENTIQGDYTLPVGVSTIEVGTKWVFRSSSARNLNTFGTEPGLSEAVSRFTNRIDVGGAYAQWTGRWRKLNFRAGLRYEYAYMKSHTVLPRPAEFSASFNDFVPSASMAWMASRSSTVNFSYARRIGRPGIWYLNPVHNQTPTNDSYGNPDLKSMASDGLSASYGFFSRKFNINLSGNFNWTNSDIVPVQTLNPDGVLVTTFRNGGKSRTASASLYAQWRVTKTTQWMFNGSATYRIRRQTGLKLSGWNYSLYTRVSQQLPWRLRANVSFWRSTMGIMGVYSRDVNMPFFRQINNSIDLSRSFLKGDRLTVSLMAYNLFGPNTWRTATEEVRGDMLGRSFTYSHNQRDVTLTVSYRFGSLRAQVRRANNSINNDDVLGNK